MKDTHFVIPPDKANRHAKALPYNPDTGRPQTMPGNTKPMLFECGGGCAVSTVADYLRFALMMLDKGRLGDARILSRKAVEYMNAGTVKTIYSGGGKLSFLLRPYLPL